MNSVLIDVAIGLVTLFFVYALFCSMLAEIVAGLLNLRGATLWEGVQSLLLAKEPVRYETDAKHQKSGIVKKMLNRSRIVDPNDGAKIADAMLAHPQIQGKVADKFGPFELLRWIAGSRRPSGATGRAKPGYLSAATFAAVLSDILRTKFQHTSGAYTDLAAAIRNMPTGDLKSMFEAFLLQAKGDPVKVMQQIEAAFAETMERVGGWYKRRTQAMLFVIGLLLAGVLNIDTLLIAHHLATDAKARAVLVQAGTGIANAGSADAVGQQRAVQLAQLAGDTVPVGWPAAWWPRANTSVWEVVINHNGDLLLMFAGWFLTACAAAMGAPLWFDLLSRLIPMRSSGKSAAGEKAPSAPAGAAPAPPAAVPDAVAPPRPVSLRYALNDYEALLDDDKIMRIKRQLERKYGATLSLDASLGDDTRAAIRRAQQALGLATSGKLSATFLHHLFAAPNDGDDGDGGDGGSGAGATPGGALPSKATSKTEEPDKETTVV